MGGSGIADLEGVGHKGGIPYQEQVMLAQAKRQREREKRTGFDRVTRNDEPANRIAPICMNNTAARVSPSPLDYRRTLDVGRPAATISVKLLSAQTLGAPLQTKPSSLHPLKLDLSLPSERHFPAFAVFCTRSLSLSCLFCNAEPLGRAFLVSSGIVQLVAPSYLPLPPCNIVYGTYP